MEEREPEDTAGFIQLGEHDAAIRCLDFAPDGSVLFSASHDNTTNCSPTM